jgi:hypothetical protein
MKAYKHTSSEFIGGMLERGIIRIGTFESYGAIKGPQRDVMEGKILYHGTGKADFRDNPSAETFRDFRRMGMHIDLSKGGTVGEIQFNNARSIIRLPPLYLLCLSQTSTNRGTMEDGYDATVEVSDLDDLARQLAAAHPNHLGHWKIAPVQYRSRTLHYRAQGPGSDPDPFFKEERFRPEQEIRIAWKPAQPFSPRPPVEPFLAECPNAARLFKRL